MTLKLIFVYIFLQLVGNGMASQATTLSKATIKFALDLMKKSGNSDKNIFFSPASISVCVGMAYAGASGETKSQINKALFDNLTDQDIYEQMQNLSTILNTPSNAYSLSIANRLYNQKHFVILQPYINKLKSYFSSEIISADFATQAEQTRLGINEWVENQTHDKIKNLLPEGSLDAAVRLVLVNAIYFKGEWALKFKESDTSKKPFYITQNSNKSIDMMLQLKKKFYYTQNEDLQLLGLPYDSEDLALFIVLPKQKFGLSQLESKFNGKDLLDMMKNAYKTEIDEVQVPKFKLEHSFDLKSILQLMGVTKMFSLEADFSGIDDKKDLYVSKAFHKAFIEVNEQGSEAAGATSIVITKSLRLPPHVPKLFIADHPFLFCIIDRRVWNPLFFGRFVG